MATWEEMMGQGYNPVNTVRDRHQLLMEKRQAENLARMQAANPGYLPGGQMQGGQGFQRFDPPSVMANKDEWLESQFNMANEHLGGMNTPAAPQAVAEAAATGGGMMGGPGGGEGEFGGSSGSTFGGMPMGDMPGDLSSAINDVSGLPSGFASVLGGLFPNFAPIINQNTISPEMEADLNELGGMIKGGTVPDIGKLAESHIDPDTLGSLPGVGIFGGRTGRATGGAIFGGGANAPNVDNPTGSGFTGQTGGIFGGGGSGGREGGMPGGGSGTGGAPSGSAAGGI